LQGKFIFCVDHQELGCSIEYAGKQPKLEKVYCREEKLKATLKDHLFDGFAETELADCDAAVTTCELALC